MDRGGEILTEDFVVFCFYYIENGVREVGVGWVS